MRAPRRTAAFAAALALALAQSAPAGQDALERVDAAYAARRYDEALAATAELADRPLAAEWASHLHSVGGDLPGALREARAGLALAPQHAGLLLQALSLSLTLGLAESAVELAARLRADGVSLDEAQTARARELAEGALALAQREQSARRGAVRARTLALAGLLASLCALLALARVPRQ